MQASKFDWVGIGDGGRDGATDDGSNDWANCRDRAGLRYTFEQPNHG